MIRAAFLALAALAGTAADAVAQDPLGVRVEAGAPVVLATDVLDDRALAEAVRSGLPLRMRFRAELWRDTWFDDLVAQTSWTAVLVYEPLERRFLAVTPGSDSVARFDEYDRARAALEQPYSPPMRSTEPGRYYYLVYLEIETLSLSDLDELERWLRGELGPAVRGGESITGAIGTGLKRLLVRVLGLPARRYEARSEPFRVR
ncbi:MAG: DUF4390 domain-containing protein [Longimicrobiales bacterium]|nr:DUF4390 domain-containing protein [Longimicrobiales bacterium]